jgi:hypothetical protein
MGVLDNLRGGTAAGGPLSARDDYVRKVSEAESTFRSLFVGSDLAATLRSDRYWHLLSLNADSGLPWLVLHSEIDEQRLRFEDLLESLDWWNRFAQRPGEIVMPDTNTLMHYKRFTEITSDDWRKDFHLSPVRLVVPIRVLDELDSLKYSGATDKHRHRAGAVLRTFDPFIDDAAKPDGSAQIRPGVTLEVLVNELGIKRPENHDTEIMDHAALVQQMTDKVVNLLTADRGMRIRATALGLKVAQMPEEGYRRPLGTDS